MTLKLKNPSNFQPGDQVIAVDSAGNRYRGYLDHANPCGQYYFLPDSTRQPFYAFPSALTATGERQPGFVSTVDDNLGVEFVERQEVYVRHMRRHLG